MNSGHLIRVLVSVGKGQAIGPDPAHARPDPGWPDPRLSRAKGQGLSSGVALALGPAPGL